MFSFTFQNKTKIIFGQNKIAALSKKIPAGHKVLVTYGGGSIKSNGVYDQVLESLKEFEWGEFGGIEPNPQYETLMNAVQKIRNEKYDYILAVGGGSVIDGSKFIVAAACYEGDDPWQILAGGAKVGEALPLATVLTLPATGSESNMGAVISRGEDKLVFSSPLVAPKFSILDPTTTLTLSPRQVANGVVDAFVHIIEQYLTFPVNAKVQDRFCEGLLMTLIEEGPKALANPQDLGVRSNLMWTATLALNGLIGVGVPQDWTTHMIGHELTGHFGIDHARTLSIVLPAVMKFRFEQKEQKMSQYAQRVFGVQKAEEAIDKTVQFFKQMEMPTSLSDVELDSKAIEAVVDSLEKHGRFGLGEHGDIGPTQARQILEVSLK